MAPKLQAATSAQSSPQSSFSARGGVSSFSCSIAKKQPIIRVVHTFAPKLITAEPANFRALVQKLTGNHAHEEAYEDIISVNHDDIEGVNHERTLGSEQHASEKASRVASSATSDATSSSSSTAAITSTPQTQQRDYEESISHHDHLLYEAELRSHGGHRTDSNYTELASNWSDYSPSHMNPYSSTTSWDSNTTARFEEDNSLFSELDILSCLDSATPLIELDPELPPLTMASTGGGFYFLPC